MQNIKACDGCGGEIITGFHRVKLEFNSFFTDTNTGMVEEMPNMARQTQNIYCTECLKALTNHMTKFLIDVSSEGISHESKADYEQSIADVQSDAPDAGKKGKV